MLQEWRNESAIAAAIATGKDYFYSDGHWEFGMLRDRSDVLTASACAGEAGRGRKGGGGADREREGDGEEEFQREERWREGERGRARESE